jgi:hypothetical protein
MKSDDLFSLRRKSPPIAWSIENFDRRPLDSVGAIER